jgi:hypothetical protein
MIIEQIEFSPQRSSASLLVDVVAGGLVINGITYLLPALGAAAPTGPILSAAGGVVRLLLPLGASFSPEAAFPQPVAVDSAALPEGGALPVPVPGHTRAKDEAGAVLPQPLALGPDVPGPVGEDGEPGPTLPGEPLVVVVEAVAPPSLEAQRGQVWEQIKARREALKSGGIRVGDHWFHSDADSRIQQLGLVIMGANMPPGLQWKTIDNGLVPMSPALAGQIFAATAQHDAQVFGAAEVHRAALWASAEPLAYDWSAGWPDDAPQGVV